MNIKMFILMNCIPVFAFAKLSMNEYLNQVRGSHQEFRSSKMGLEGARLRTVESELVTLPVLSVSAQNQVNKAPSTTPTFTGDSTTSDSLSATISEQTDFGLNASIGYTWAYKKITNASFITIPEYYAGSPSVSLTQSFWRNYLGTETRYLKDQIQASAKLAEHNSRYKFKTVLIDAQNTFLKLYFVKKTILALQESLNHSSKLRDWAEKRSKINLGDKSDFFQTKAAYEARMLDLVKAQMDEKSASRYFNSLRGIDSSHVNEELSEPDTISLDFKKSSLSPNKWRDDVMSAVQALKLSKAQSGLGKEKNTPSLNLQATYSFNSLDTSNSNAFTNSFQNTYPVYSFGVIFSTPLAFGADGSVLEGYEKEVFAADLNVQRKYLEQERDFNDLQDKIENAAQRLKLAQTLESSQKAKVENERKRHREGRTTLFNVLQYEQDYVGSQLKTIEIENEYRNLVNQLEYYQGGES